MDWAPRRLTVGRIMAIVALLAIGLGAGLFIRQNGDIEQALVARHLRQLGDANPAVRADAADDLSRDAPRSPGPILQALAGLTLSDPNAATRRVATRSLGVVLARTARRPTPRLTGPAARRAPPIPASPIGDDPAEADAFRALVRAFGDPHPPVRRAAIESFGNLIPHLKFADDLDQLALPPLLACLDDADSVVRAQVVKTLGDYAHPPEKARPRVIALIRDDPDVHVRMLAILAIRRSWGPGLDLYEALLDRARHAPSEEERLEAVQSLETLPPPPPAALGPLLALAEADESASSVALEILGRAGSMARPLLPRLQTLADQRDRERGEVAWIKVADAIASIAPDSPEAQGLLPRIDSLLQEASHGVDRNDRGRLLIQRYGPAAAPLVSAWRKRLIDPNATPESRHQVARLLGGIGAPAVAALDDLEALARTDPDDSIRWALARLRLARSTP